MSMLVTFREGEMIHETALLDAVLVTAIAIHNQSDKIHRSHTSDRDDRVVRGSKMSNMSDGTQSTMNATMSTTTTTINRKNTSRAAKSTATADRTASLQHTLLVLLHVLTKNMGVTGDMGATSSSPGVEDTAIQVRDDIGDTLHTRCLKTILFRCCFFLFLDISR